MVVKRSKPRKIKKVTYYNSEVTAAQTEESETIHTIENPSTTKRMIFDLDLVCPDVPTDGGYWKFGLCITRPGETLPQLANINSEETRWLYFTAGIENVTDNVVHIERDLKIQRKVKDGDVLSLVIITRDIAYYSFAGTVFIDET